MKKIETTNIAGSQDAPYVKATFDHYNEAILNSTSEIVKGILGSYTTGDVIILHGCVVSGTIGPGTAAVTAGSIYYNGEIYTVEADASIVTTGAQTLVWSISTTYRAGDPVVWSDGVSRNLHQIDSFVLSEGLSGSGIADYNGATIKKLLSKLVDRGYSEINSDRTESTGTPHIDAEATIFTITTPNDGVTRDYHIMLTSVIDGTGSVFNYISYFKIGATTHSTNNASIASGTRISYTHNAVILAVPPNTAILIRDQRGGGTTGTVNLSKLTYMGFAI